MSEFKIEPKQVLNKVRVALSMDLKLAQMKAEDGMTVFEAEMFETDYSVGIVQEEGIVPAPIGEYVLEDGRVMVIEVDGVIARIDEKKSEEVEPEVEAEAEASTTPTKTVETVEKTTFFTKQEAEGFLKEHEVALSEVENLKAKNAELEVKLAEAIKVKPIKHNPEANKVKYEDMSPVEKFRYHKNN